ncbi:neutral zinc metallopeptidase [Membranicola marinus]|uniref:Neutral zinc metallopeptidase n=1 Tax=Membranihabitans marinus TaxID=1227546 RepID=A0A953HTH2_9BACT|nr:neutral zinc metallopeptidase [Membranihabitans marinus]MBY5957588.1 neutral zinc metallopeptidase [Membranihabitans marinus]
MQWRGNKKSSRVEDRRGSSTGRRAAKGGGIIAIILVLISVFTGKDLTGLLSLFEPGTSVQTEQPVDRGPRPDDDLAEMVSVILASTEDVWTHLFQEQNSRYSAPNLVLFDERTSSACGMASSAMGPFYCPGDEKVYIDLSFCNDLKTRFQAPGDFAVAYVVAHEVGHHVQNLMGITDQVHQMRSRLSQKDYNALSVKLELQADFLAGIWGYYAQDSRLQLNDEDLEEALRAANAIGDDRIQKQTQGYVVPDAFTHGTSQQRMHWFRKGFESGDLSLGEFNAIN